MKLFPKLALTVSGLLIGTIVCLSLAFYWMEERSIREQAAGERRALLQNLVHIAQESFLTNDDLLLVKYTGWIQKWNPSLVSASVTDPQGEIIAHSEPSQIGKAVLTPPAPSPAEMLVLNEPVQLGSHWVATASLGFSQRYYEQVVRRQLDELQHRVGQVALGSLTLSLLICFGFALSWTRPIDALVKAAARLGQGKYDFDLAVTERRRDELGFLSRAFSQTASELQELDNLKEDFVAAVTHELRSPLGAIESYLNVMEEEFVQGIPEATWRTYLNRMRVNTQRLTRFVNDLLDVAAIERGKIVLEPQWVNLTALAQEAVAFFEPKLKEKSLTAGVTAPAQPLQAWADPDKLRQVLVNLLSNAIKFTPLGGRISVAVAPVKDKRVRISVKDSGIGIAPADQQKIFNKFEQVRSARQKVKGPKGTGLGLAVSRSLVELHGGAIGLESRLGEGSTFYFEIPVESAGLPGAARTTPVMPGGVL